MEVCTGIRRMKEGSTLGYSGVGGGVIVSVSAHKRADLLTNRAGHYISLVQRLLSLSHSRAGMWGLYSHHVKFVRLPPRIVSTCVGVESYSLEHGLMNLYSSSLRIWIYT